MSISGESIADLGYVIIYAKKIILEDSKELKDFYVKRIEELINNVIEREMEK